MAHTKFMPLPPVYTVTPPPDDPPDHGPRHPPSRSRSPIPRLGPRTPRGSRSPSPAPSSPKLSRSIQDLLRLAVRKVVPGNKKSSPSTSRRTSCLLDVPQESAAVFRTRSKSLDDGNRKTAPSDCETTYRIYDSILQEGE